MGIAKRKIEFFFYLQWTYIGFCTEINVLFINVKRAFIFEETTRYPDQDYLELFRKKIDVFFVYRREISWLYCRTILTLLLHRLHNINRFEGAMRELKMMISSLSIACTVVFANMVNFCKYENSIVVFYG